MSIKRLSPVYTVNPLTALTIHSAFPLLLIKSKKSIEIKIRLKEVNLNQNKIFRSILITYLESLVSLKRMALFNESKALEP